MSLVNTPIKPCSCPKSKIMFCNTGEKDGSNCRSTRVYCESCRLTGDRVIYPIGTPQVKNKEARERAVELWNLGCVTQTPIIRTNHSF